MTQYHQVWTSTALCGPSTTNYSPAQPNTDPLPPSTSQHRESTRECWVQGCGVHTVDWKSIAGLPASHFPHRHMLIGTIRPQMCALKELWHSSLTGVFLQANVQSNQHQFVIFCKGQPQMTITPKKLLISSPKIAFPKRWPFTLWTFPQELFWFSNLCHFTRFLLIVACHIFVFVWTQ